jgi:recombination protein RecA
VVKNKLAPPFRQAEFDIMYGKGVNNRGELVDIGANLGLVGKSGSWYSMGDERIGQGRDSVVNYLAENGDVEQKLRLEIMTQHGIGTPPMVSEVPAEG